MTTEHGKAMPGTETGKSKETNAGATGPERSLDADVEIARREEQRMLMAALESPAGTSPEAALNVVATFDAKAITDDLKEELAIIAGDYGLTVDELPDAEKAKLAAFWLGVKEGRNDKAKEATADALEYRIGQMLFDNAMGKVDGLVDDLERNWAESYEQLEAKLRGVMRSISEAAKSVPVDEEHEEEWKQLDLRYSQLIAMRGEDAGVRGTFEKVLNEHSDFIEYDLVTHRLEKDRGDVQGITQELYGRTPEEVEAIKRENREEVVERIKELSAKPALEIKDLEDLHRINNRGIVPKKFAAIRRDEGAMPPTFDARIGLFADDLRPSLEDMLAAANDVRARGVGENDGQYTAQEYAIVAAQLHNQLLDMHPWSDRNGSTSLLFLETLMTKAGYEPPATREKDFYKNLGAILDNDPVAMTVVAEEMVRIKNEPGYFEGKANESPEKRKKYRQVINLMRSLSRRPAVDWGDDDEG